MKAIIFDFDGVIVGNREENYKCHKMKYCGLTPKSHQDLFNGNVYEVRKKLIEMGIIKEKSTKHIHEILKENILDKVDIKINVLNVLQKLKQKNYMLFILSSNNEENIKEYLKKKHCLKFFSEIIGYDAHSKKVEKFEYLFKKFNLSINESFFITDTLGDILEANMVGIRTIAVNFGIHPKGRLKLGKPFKIVSNFEEIYTIVAEQ